MALTTIKTGGLADNSVTDAKVADAITVTGAQTGITQVGTLTAGTWQGTAIASAYLDADTAHLTTTQTFTGTKTFQSEHTYLENTGGNCNLFIKSSNSGNARLYLGDVADAGAGFIDYDNGTNMTIGTEGTVALTIDSSQKVGIRESAPSAALHVVHGSGITLPTMEANARNLAIFEGDQSENYISIATPNTAYAGINFTDTGHKAAGWVQYKHESTATNDYMRFAVNESERLRITATGNVGIGASSVSSRATAMDDVGPVLELYNVGQDSALQLTSDSGGRGLDLWNDHSGANVYFDSRYDSSNTSGGNIYFRTRTSDETLTAMTINQAAYVGIGEASPDTNLQVKSAQAKTIKLEAPDSVGGPYIIFNNDSSTIGYVGQAGGHLTGGSTNLGIRSEGALLLGTNGNNTRVTVASDGHVTCHQKLTVSSDFNQTYGDAKLYSSVMFGTTTNSTQWEDSSGNGSMYYQQHSASRNTGIAISSDTSVGYAMFYINAIDGANDERFMAFYRNNSQIGTISLNGTSNVSYDTSSDYRLKENIEPMTGSIARLKQIKPSTFNFISEPDRSCEGFIAHELGEVVPNAVSGKKDAMRDDGEKIMPQGVDFGRVVPLLVSALQEAIERIEVLENA